MAELIELPTHTDPKGSLTVLEKSLPFIIKRAYWIYDIKVDETRGQHRHYETMQAMICLNGSCDVTIKKHGKEEIMQLNKPNTLLILQPEDWHAMSNFGPNTILLLLASHDYNPNDYCKEPL